MRLPRRDLRRPRASRDPSVRVLVVCEGSRTEPRYFSELRDFYELHTATVEVSGTGADPRTVVRRAKQLRRQEARIGERYDEVFCVFDRDSHATFESACEEARVARLKVIRSWPCFEYWLLLHFSYSRAPFVGSGESSACDRCIRELRSHWPDYRKATQGSFSRLASRLETATVRAVQAMEDADKTGERNPSTEVHRLVAHLASIAPSRR